MPIPEETVFAQQGFRCRLEWGHRGVRDAARRGDILVIVDVLSFSSAVITGVERGASIRPCVSDAQARDAAQRFGGEVAVHRRDVPDKGRYSLSPLTFRDIAPGTRVFLPSPNGGTAVQIAQSAGAPHVFVGALLNAQATAQVIGGLLRSPEHAVTVLACGERWWTAHDDGPLRFALEDYLGAGAILSALSDFDAFVPSEKVLPLLSPEARVCAGAFQAVREDIAATLWECGSGRELRAKGFGDDVTHASHLNACDTIPWVGQDGFLVPYAPPTV
jgi:2-phosphosulfolactate phosphatase